MEDLDIGEVAAITGLQPSALRYYEERGLIDSSGRNGIRRTYRPDVIPRLALLRAAQAAGFNLAEASELLAAAPSTTAMRKSFAAKADQLDHQIQILIAARDQLRHAVQCPSPSLFDCPTFQEFVDRVLPPRRSPSSPAPPQAGDQMGAS